VGTYRELETVAQRTRPNRILVAMPDRRGQLPIQELVKCRFQGVIVEEGISAYERFSHQLAVDALTPSALIFCGGLKRSLLHRAGHRLLSLIVAAIGLVVTAPLLGIIALLIKFDSPGPVFFVQPRVGKGGEPFRLIKFRTMRDGRTVGENTWQRDNQSRITRMGRVLRRCRIDEIPQFFNILKGDMDLVGPRPEIVENADRFCREISFYALRHTERPGLTGWAQIRFPYAMSREEVTKKLCYDLYYIKNLSLWFDIRILFDTAKVMLLGRGAQ
jgi:exopolysaccharide biosynthesis polyprenyl glycosylphosphotransferase